MSKQSEALRLAQALNNRQECEDEAADELRRLHALNAELLEALKLIAWSNDSKWQADCARAAIARAEGGGS